MFVIKHQATGVPLLIQQCFYLERRVRLPTSAISMLPYQVEPMGAFWRERTQGRLTHTELQRDCLWRLFNKRYTAEALITQNFQNRRDVRKK